MSRKRQSAKKLLKKNNTRNNRKSSRKSTRKRKAMLSKINGGGDPVRTISSLSEGPENSNSNNIVVILEKRKQQIIKKLNKLNHQISKRLTSEFDELYKNKKDWNKLVEYLHYFKDENAIKALAKIEQKLDSEGKEVTGDSMFQFLKELKELIDEGIFEGDEDRKIFEIFIMEMYNV